MAKQVLLIDDDANARKYLSVVLDDHGYDVAEACNGSEGLEVIEQIKPDLIVLDVMMPKKSGLVLFKQLKRDEQYREIPIIMVTGLAGAAEEIVGPEDESLDSSYDSLRKALRRMIREMREEGMVRPDVFLDKPVAADVFMANVRKLLED